MAFWSTERPEVIAVTHISSVPEPSLGSPAHLCSSDLKRRKLIVWQRSEWATPTTYQDVPLHNTARPSCQELLYVKTKKNKSKEKRQKDNWGFYFAASCSFCLCVPFMTIVITFTAELKNRQNFCKRLGKLIRDKLHGLFGADNSAHIKHLLAI